MKPHLTACTMQLKSGQFCDAETAEDMPFPICLRHALQVYRRIRQTVAAVERDPAAQTYYVLQDMEREQRRQQRRKRARDVVYYVRVGRHIKIGFTTDIRSRMAQYGPDRVLLATEPGDLTTEQERLWQFREYLDHGREWFLPGESLLAHIESLKAEAA